MTLGFEDVLRHAVGLEVAFLGWDGLSFDNFSSHVSVFGWCLVVHVRIYGREFDLL
jgi:hypothetical protein